MNRDPSFGILFRNSLFALVVGVALVLFCYLFVDRPVAFFMHDQGFADYPFLKWLTYPPPIAQSWSPFVLAMLVVRRVFGLFRRWELTLFAASVAIVLSDQFRESISFLFGRYWPETWIDNNPSLIGTGAYGFHPFHSGSAYGSFPSGHTTRTLAAAAVVWIAYPHWRAACILASAAVVTGLIGMDYHFVGDIIAGGILGSIVGTYTSKFCGLMEDKATPADSYGSDA
ncbi:phosphatase PAP2 family protein [Calycomorphotria hydatis]|uniref:phosphatase PAP2 family protein n=1 Tax=Calycomorphotria hydatis TaxID=2528027 RepID=UPI0018D220FD|nr:phosphatase PAP2 family protein [Calycomorphotria hydatis]